MAYLLLQHPPSEPIHALDLATRVAGLHRKHLGLTEVLDLNTGRTTTLESHALLQQRSLGLETAETVRNVLHRQNLLEALCEDEDTTEPVKREAELELIQLYRYEEHNTARTRDSAQKCARAVRMAINRFHRHLANALDASGGPHPVLRPFAAHLKQYLLVPSARYAESGRLHARPAAAGCFTYEAHSLTWAQ